jgi:uncharacterized membrane protein YqjE
VSTPGSEPLGTAGTAAGPGAEPSKSVGELVGDIARDLGTLMRQELDLAKTEIKQEASKAGKGAGMLGGAGVAGLLVLIFLTWTIVYVLENVMAIEVALLIVTVLWGVVAAVLAASGRKKLKQVDPTLEATKETLKEDARWAKTATRND